MLPAASWVGLTVLQGEVERCGLDHVTFSTPLSHVSEAVLSGYQRKLSWCFQAKSPPSRAPNFTPALVLLIALPPRESNDLPLCPLFYKDALFLAAGKHTGKSGLPGSLNFLVQFSSYLPDRTPPPLTPTRSHSDHHVPLWCLLGYPEPKIWSQKSQLCHLLTDFENVSRPSKPSFSHL